MAEIDDVRKFLESTLADVEKEDWCDDPEGRRGLKAIRALLDAEREARESNPPLRNLHERCANELAESEPKPAQDGALRAARAELEKKR